jgi:FtsH-binding integral membrane protein
MANLDPRYARGAVGAVDTLDTGLRAYMLRVYNYMLVGLGLTGTMAWLTANTPLSQVFYNQVTTPNGVALAPNILGWVAIFAPLAMVFFLSFRIQKMSFATAQTTLPIHGPDRAYPGVCGRHVLPFQPAAVRDLGTGRIHLHRPDRL